MNQLKASRFNTPQGDRTAISTPTYGTSSQTPIKAMALNNGKLQVSTDNATFSDIDTSAPYINITNVPSTATEGTLIAAQRATLNSSPQEAYIMFYGEKFIPMDVADSKGYRVYTHHGETDGTKIETSKFIYLTLSTGAWVMNVNTEKKYYLVTFSFTPNVLVTGTATFSFYSSIKLESTADLAKNIPNPSQLKTCMLLTTANSNVSFVSINSMTRIGDSIGINYSVVDFNTSNGLSMTRVTNRYNQESNVNVTSKEL